MKIIRNLFGSSLGKKYIMAVTGICLFGFVAGHMVGNLQIFLGPEAINRYGHFLQSNVELLWPVRIGMLTLIALHIWSAARLEIENRAARGPEGYAVYKPVGSTLASRTMLMSGLIVFCFIVYHILHYTVRVQAVNLGGHNFLHMPDPIDPGRHDIYRMMILGFRQPIVSAFYLLGVGLLCIHLSHGVTSMFQSLGLKNAGWRAVLDKASKLIAIALFLGYSSIPVAVLLRLIGKEVVK